MSDKLDRNEIIEKIKSLGNDGIIKMSLSAGLLTVNDIKFEFNDTDKVKLKYGDVVIVEPKWDGLYGKLLERLIGISSVIPKEPDFEDSEIKTTKEGTTSSISIMNDANNTEILFPTFKETNLFKKIRYLVLPELKRAEENVLLFPNVYVTDYKIKDIWTFSLMIGELVEVLEKEFLELQKFFVKNKDHFINIDKQNEYEKPITNFLHIDVARIDYNCDGSVKRRVIKYRLTTNIIEYLKKIEVRKKLDLPSPVKEIKTVVRTNNIRRAHYNDKVFA